MDYELYYWDMPFRGNFVKLLLEELSLSYKNRDAGEIYPNRRLKIEYPAMAPPYLHDKKKDRYLAQMPAILMYLSTKYDFHPRDIFSRDLSLKLILDCNDILYEITRYHGEKMWDRPSWEEFRYDRFPMWMKIFELTGVEHGLKSESGFMFGSSATVADIATTALFGTLIHCFPKIRKDLEEHAPSILGLCERVEKRKGIKEFLEAQRKDYGDSYCGGQIEASLKKMLQ